MISSARQAKAAGSGPPWTVSQRVTAQPRWSGERGLVDLDQIGAELACEPGEPVAGPLDPGRIHGARIEADPRLDQGHSGKGRGALTLLLAEAHARRHQKDLETEFGQGRSERDLERPAAWIGFHRDQELHSVRLRTCHLRASPLIC